MGLVISKNMYSMHFDEYVRKTMEGALTHPLHKIKDGFIETFGKSRDFHKFFLLSLFTKGSRNTPTLNMTNFR